MRSENERGRRNVVNPDHKTPICGLKAVFVRSISGKRQGTLFFHRLTKIRDRPDNPGFPLKIDNLFKEKYV
jgi:hypothetical protein